MEAGGLGVDLLVAGGDAGDAIAALGGGGDLLEGRAEDDGDRLRRALRFGARELVDGLLGAVDELLDDAHVPVAFGGDLLAHGDEVAEAPLLVDDRGVRSDVGHGGRRVGELGQVARPADLRELLAIAEPRGHRDDVDRRAQRGEVVRGLEDLAVGVAVEMLGLEDLEHAVEGLAAEEHGGEHRGLGVEVVRGTRPAIIAGSSRCGSRP